MQTEKEIIQSINHFVLWCKGWYQPVDEKENTFHTLKKVLYLDDFCFVKSWGDIISIILNKFDMYNEWHTKEKGYPFMTYFQFYNEIQNIDMYYPDNNFTDSEKIIRVIRDKFRYTSFSRILNHPKYDRQLYRMGLRYGGYDYKKGMTYKNMNKIVSKLFG